MIRLRNWCDQSIELAQSAGGVLAFLDPFSALVRGGVEPWPPPEIVQKLYQSRQQRAYSGPDLVAVTRCLGFYSDLQSIHSEDAITWSVFGPLAYAEPSIRSAYFSALLRELSISAPSSERVHVSLWRRIPHPDTLVPGGPEIDFLLQSSHTLILGEAKWRSSFGKAQGKLKDKDQLTLRLEFLEKYGTRFFPGVTRFVLLVASLSGSIIVPSEHTLAVGSLLVRELNWSKITHLQPHPVSQEIIAYFQWKQHHSRA